ncbi:hypothetical protein Ctob_006234, partial [Chrysochromulina tobinii]
SATDCAALERRVPALSSAPLLPRARPSWLQPAADLQASAARPKAQRKLPAELSWRCGKHRSGCRAHSAPCLAACPVSHAPSDARRSTPPSSPRSRYRRPNFRAASPLQPPPPLYGWQARTQSLDSRARTTRSSRRTGTLGARSWSSTRRRTRSWSSTRTSCSAWAATRPTVCRSPSTFRRTLRSTTTVTTCRCRRTLWQTTYAARSRPSCARAWPSSTCCSRATTQTQARRSISLTTSPRCRSSTRARTATAASLSTRCWTRTGSRA